MKKYGYVEPVKPTKIDIPETIDLKEFMDGVYHREVETDSDGSYGSYKPKKLKSKAIPAPEVFDPTKYFIMT